MLVVDRQTDHQKVLYGRSTLELISTGLHPDVTVKAKALRLPVDFDSDDVEQVGAVCLESIFVSRRRVKLRLSILQNDHRHSRRSSV